MPSKSKRRNQRQQRRRSMRGGEALEDINMKLDGIQEKLDTMLEEMKAAPVQEEVPAENGVDEDGSAPADEDGSAPVEDGSAPAAPAAPALVENGEEVESANGVVEEDLKLEDVDEEETKGGRRRSRKQRKHRKQKSQRRQRRQRR